MTTQNNPVGNGMRVLSVSGEVLTRGADGNMRQVVPGEYLAPGDILVTRAGAVLLQNAQGQYAEIPPNHSLTVSPAMVGLFLPGGTEAVLSPSPDESQTGAPVNTAGTDDGFGESGGGAIRNWNGHGFVRLPRINFFHDQNLSRWDNLGRDVNETFTFMGRHTMNPRIGYEYSTDRAPLDEFRPETDRLWWGDREPSRDDFINRPPLVSPPDGGVTDEDVPLVLDLLKYASDPEGKPVAIISAEAGSGTVVIHPDGTVTYTPNEDFHGEDTITFTVSDGFGGTTTSTVTVTVNPVVDIAPDAAETTEDTPVVTDVLANDTFGPNAEVTAVTQGSGGSVTINPDGTVTYTPGPGFQGLAEGETGTDTYTYTVTTAAGNTETTTVTVIIHGLNDGPVGSDLPGQSDLDGEAVAVSVAGAFSDPDATDVLTYSTTGLPAGLTIDPLTGVISGTIDNSASQGSTGANPAGTYTVVVTATDPHGASVSETFQWTVTNPGPDAVNDVNSVEQNEVLTVGTAGGVLANDADPDGDVLTVSAVNGVAGNLGNPVAGSDGGTFTLNGDGSYTFNPGNAFEYLAAGESKTTSITYTISDGEGGTDTATLSVTVNGENQAPVGNQLPPQSDLDGESVTLSLAGAFSDPDTSDVLTYSAEGLPAGLSIDPVSGVISGTIDNSASQAGTSGNPDGTYTVVITATDPQGASVNETFTWTVANPVPDAVDDVNSTGENTPLTVSAAAGVLGNDTDPDGDALTVSAVNGAAGNIGNSVAGSNGGTFTLNADGSYDFDPGTAFDDLSVGENRTTSINYTVSDGEGGTDTATLTITVNGVNDVPVVNELPPQSDIDGGEVTLSLAGAFSDPDTSDVLTYSAEGLPAGLSIDPVSGVISGTIDNSASQAGTSGNPDGTYTVVITATDPQGASVNETFTWTVANPVPDAVDDVNSTGENTPLTVSAAAGVLGNDTDPDGDALTVSAVNGASGNIGNSVAGSNGGTFTLNADGSYDFDPGTAFDDLSVGENRTTSINYTVSDGEGGTDTATLTITVNGVNDVPVVNELPPQSDIDGGEVTLSLAGAFSDPDTSDVLTYSAEGLPAGLSIDPVSGVISGTIDNSASQAGTSGNPDGTYTVVITATDPQGASVNETFTWTVANPVPDAVDDVNSTGENTPLTVSAAAGVLGNDTDPDGDALTVSAVNGASGNIGNSVAGSNGGTFTLNADGSYDFDPGTAFDDLSVGENRTTSINYTVSDGEGGTDTATLTITVNGVNDTPLAVDDANCTGENTPLTISAAEGVLKNDSDPDGDALTVGAVNGAAGNVGGSVTGSAGGTFVLNADGSYTFNPGTAFDDLAVGENRTTSINYTVSDGEGGSDTATLTITVNGINDAPVAKDDSGNVKEDTKLTETGNVLSNDTDVDNGASLTVTGVNGEATLVGTVVSGTYGTVAIAADGTYTYTLTNGDPAVQALAVGETLTESFTYTVSDGQGSTDTTTLTITVNGTNDAPVISLTGTDSAAASFTETNAGLSESGTLTLTDIDLTNTVGTSVVSVAAGGFTDGLILSNAQLLSMLTASGALNSAQTAGSINWTFDSGSEAFNFLPAGQQLTLTYTVRATDSSGASDDQTVSITVTGTNDSGVIKPDTAVCIEDFPLAGNVLTNDTPDPDTNEPLAVTKFMIAGDPAEYTPDGTSVNIPNVGSISMNSNGTYTFTPLPNYSGPVPVITYTAGNLTFSSTATLTITLNPVSDAPSWPAHTEVTTNEDTIVALNLKMPVITDNTDKNGALPGDHPERLGFITLESIDAGTQIYKGDGTTLLFTGANNTMRIVIVDSMGNMDSSVHYTNLASDISYASAIKLTQAEFQALMALPSANRHNDVDMTLRVTSYETDDSGNKDTNVTGATAALPVHVEVLAVTDPVDLKIAGSDTSHTVTINEDSFLNLTELLTTSFNDTDGSEYRSIILENLPLGTNVNGNVIGASGTITIPLTGGNTIPPINLTPPRNFSGDITDISVTLRAKDADSDSPGHTPAVETDTVTLDLHVNPVAGDVSAGPVTTNEDTGVKFLNTITLTDTDGSESITAITVKDVPTGWVVKDEGGVIVFTGDGSADYTVPAGDVASGEYKNYTITPPAHSSVDGSLTLAVITSDTKTVNGIPLTAVTTKDLPLAVVVHPVAEVTTLDSNNDGTPDLTLNGDFNYATPASEDTWFPLNTNGFDFKTPWTNQDADGSEKTFALLTPVLNGGIDSANGSRFSYVDGSGNTQTLTYFTGSPVAIPVEFLNTVQFIAPPNVAGSFQIQIQAKTVDTDPNTSEVVTAISGNAVLTNLIVQPVADLVTLAASSPAKGNEDTPLDLNIRPSSSDPSETFTVTISSIPAGSVLTYKGVVQDSSTGSVTIENFDRTAPLTILPPHDSNADFTLNVSAVSVDTSGGVTDISSAQTLQISVDLQGVADPANITISSPNFTEAQVDGDGHGILLSNFITGASLTDTDGSETLSLVVTGLDPKFSISGGTFVGGTGEGRQWIICAAALPTCKIVAPANFSGTVDFDVRAVTTEDDGHSLTGPFVPVSGTITPSPEAEMVTSTVADEDTLTKLNFDIQQRNGDADEEITSVSVRISEMEGHGFSLFLGNSGTTLATAAGQAGSGVTIDGDFYKISGTALGNIWAKGDPNSSGEHAFDIRYEVTDPSSDGTLPAVASTTNGTYTLTVNSVTDDTTTTLTNLTASNGNAVISGSTVTASGTTTISMDVVVQQAADLQAGNTPDTDGSEHLLRFVIDGVPDGVTVQGGVYIGDTPGNPNTGQWLVDVSPDEAFAGSGTLIQTLVFQLDGTADFLSDLNQTITVTAVTQDGESAGEMISGASFTILTPSDFNASMPSADVPAVITEAEFTPLAPGALEDGGMNLNDLVDFELTGSSPFSITLTGIPAGSAVSGMTMTMVNGEEIWTASGSGGDGALQSLLSGITITPPENWNDNNHPGGLTFEAKLTTYTPSGAQNNAQVDIVQPVGPVSDATEISISAPEGSEDSSVDLTISLANAADGAFNTIVDGKLYISLNQAALDSGGKLYYEGVEVTSQTVSGVTGIPNGTYYVLSGVDSGDSLALTYQPGANWSGNVTLTAGLLSTETEASNVLSASETVNFSIAPVNDGATVSALSPATGAEDTKIELALQGTLVDADGSESILSAVLGNVPDGYLVFAGADAGTAVLATNLGDDGSGNSWAIGLTGGALPAYVAILPPEHFSGTVDDLSFSIISGEEGLDPKVDTANFDLNITPVADGITLNPSLSFGTEGEGIRINLNSSMPDTDGSETVTLTLKGLGDHAAFSVGGGPFSSVYDAVTDTYTLSGIRAEDVDDLTVIQSAGNYSDIQVTGRTMDGSSESAIVSGTFNLDISEKIPTAEDDLLLYRTDGSFDGREGTDTLLLRPGEDIDFAADPLIRNMEILDLDNSGADHVISNLTVQDVLDITGETHDLTILGNSGDRVDLLNDASGSWQHSGIEVAGGITFDVYASVLNSDITVRIQQEIDDNLV